MSYLRQFEADNFPTPEGELTISFLGHGSLLFQHLGQNIYVDPFGKVADYTRLPKADLILITHEHHDHFDPQALQAIRQAHTAVVIPPACAALIAGGLVLRNGEQGQAQGVPIAAVPAYNLVHCRENGQPFHPKGQGNGYVITLGGLRIYLAGDTEDIPEMDALTGIDIAFLPMNLPYTMTPEMVARAARRFRPRLLYPYHYGKTDPQELVRLLADEPGIEVRVRQLA